ncbi:MAG: hypothetical protein AB7V32_11470, partial [Candidatus Berkiella sp.]
MKSIVTTLNHLINTANTLGNQTKDKKYFDKQAQLVSLLKNLQALEAQISNQTEDSLKALFKAAKQQIKAALAPLSGLSYPHEDFKEALDSAEFAHVSMANRVILGLKRNLELRNLAAKALQEKADAQKMQEYQDLCAKDAALLQAFQNNHALAMHEIQLANQRWAAYLQAAHDLKDLPENHVPKQTAKPSPVTDFFAPLL